MDHPPEVHAELARLSSVAIAREEAAAAEMSAPYKKYLTEVANRARAAHEKAAALVASPPAVPPPPCPCLACTAPSSPLRGSERSSVPGASPWLSPASGPI